MSSFRNNRKNTTSSSKVILVCLLLSGSLVSPGFATPDPDAITAKQYEDSWQKIEGSLTADDAVEQRFTLGERRLVDNYELFDVPIGAYISFYIKGNPNGNGLGLCDPLGIVYEVAQGPQSVVAYDNDSGKGGFNDLYDGSTCLGDFKDTFFTVSTNLIVVSHFRIQVSSSGILDNPSGLDALNKFNSGAYTLYVSVGNFIPNGPVACTIDGLFTIFKNVVTGNSDCEGEAIIPFGVTSIDEGAFEGNTSLAHVTIGNSVLNIGVDAFRDTTLESVTIGNSVKTIGNFAFSNTRLRSVTIPNSVTSIDEGAFYLNSSLAHVTIGNSVTIIGGGSFEGNTSLESVIIPDSVATIGNYAFNRTSLTSVTIPNSVTSIGDGAFIDNTALTSVTFLGDAPLDTHVNAFDYSVEPVIANVPYNATGFYLGGDGLWRGLIVRYASAPAGDSGSSSNVATIAPVVVKTADASFKLTNRKYLSKFEIRKAITKGRSFKRKPIDIYKYSISKRSKKHCVMSGNYVMALKDTGACEIWVTRTTAKGAKYKYWVKINYNK